MRMIWQRKKKTEKELKIICSLYSVVSSLINLLQSTSPITPYPAAPSHSDPHIISFLSLSPSPMCTLLESFMGMYLQCWDHGGKSLLLLPYWYSSFSFLIFFFFLHFVWSKLHALRFIYLFFCGYVCGKYHPSLMPLFFFYCLMLWLYATVMQNPAVCLGSLGWLSFCGGWSVCNGERWYSGWPYVLFWLY